MRDPESARRAVLVVLLALAGASGCDDSTPGDAPPGEPVRFVFGDRFDQTGKEDFAAVTAQPSVILASRGELDLPLESRRRFMAGRIARGGDGNLGWSWHVVPNGWELAEHSIEWCDAQPSYVEENLDEWLATHPDGEFCPWSSVLIREE